jgi:hypothetical protein
MTFREWFRQSGYVGGVRQTKEAWNTALEMAAKACEANGKGCGDVSDCHRDDANDIRAMKEEKP